MFGFLKAKKAEKRRARIKATAAEIREELKRMPADSWPHAPTSLADDARRASIPEDDGLGYDADKYPLRMNDATMEQLNELIEAAMAGEADDEVVSEVVVVKTLGSRDPWVRQFIKESGSY
jgi:hypothetical protein